MKKTVFAIVIVLTLTISAISVSALSVEEAFDFKEFSHDGLILPYRLYVPEDYNAENEYPLVVFLHGAGERGRDNDLQLKNAVQTLFDREDGLMSNSIVIAPQCPENEQWVDTPWADGNYSTDEIPESNELAAVVALVDSMAKEYSIDKARIYAMGVSMGGFGTWDLITRHNDIFAAAAPICGGGDPSKAELLINTPIYTFHGTADNSVPYEGTAEMVEALEDIGSRLINFITYDGEGHGIWEMASAEADWLEWLYEQKLTDRYPEIDETEADTETEAPEITDTDAASDSVQSESAITTEPSPESDKTDERESNENNFPIWIIAIIAAVIIALGIIIFSKKKGNKE
ncbi:MAG: prolyl oligopeptidase family serine peptidase [Clostridia bacterium]|nr:prolyl oligopeptidase family serine peptidase [Clostridia bacterium]